MRIPNEFLYHVSGRCEQRHLFSVKNTLRLRHFQEVTPGEHAESVIYLRVERSGTLGLELPHLLSIQLPSHDSVRLLVE